MIRVRFCWRRLLAPICRYGGHPEWVEHVEQRWVPRAGAYLRRHSHHCPRCYAGWPRPHAIEWG